jgi:hypothetical protein
VWVLSESSPIQRFTGSVHKLDLSVPKERLVTDAAANQVQIVVQTGDDDLRGGNNQNDNANVTLNFVGGTRVTTNINRASSWENGHTHAARLDIPTGMRVSDITGITMSTNFGGGFDGDNWNVNKVALVVAFPKGSKTKEPPPTIVHEWLDVSGAPRMRFTGDKYYLTEAIKAEDVGKPIRALDLVISTGNDDLRGGDNDNCEVYIELTDGRTIDVMNVNQGRAWKNSSTHTVSIPMPKGGIKGGDVKLVELLTHFKGGFDGDNWNVNRIQLLATLNK